MQATTELQAWVEYFRDLGIYDFYRNGEPVGLAEVNDALPTGPEADIVCIAARSQREIIVDDRHAEAQCRKDIRNCERETGFHMVRL